MISEWVLVGHHIYVLKDASNKCALLQPFSYFCKLNLEVMASTPDIARNFRSFVTILWLFKLLITKSSSTINTVFFKAVKWVLLMRVERTCEQSVTCGGCCNIASCWANKNGAILGHLHACNWISWVRF